MTYEQAINALNPDQLAAVKSDARFLRIIAGPGTGKTQTLMMRVAHLINEKKVSGYSIVCFTFTRKAANEMRERLAQFVNPAEAAKVTIGTFHAIAYRMIRQWHETLGYKSANISVLDEDDSLELLAYLARRHEPDEKKAKKLAKSACEIWTDPQYEACTPDDAPEEWNLLHDYQQALKQNNSVDYSGLIIDAKRLIFDGFTERGRAALYYHEQWKRILVDEFQDVDGDQMQFLLGLCSDGASLTVVGDDDQSIYGFRGARPEFLIDLPNHFPGAESIALRTNYRSYGEIVQAASRVIGHNEKRLPKELVAFRGESFLVDPWTVVDYDDQAKIIIDYIKPMDAPNYADIAILARTNYQLEPIAEALQGAGIPFQLVTPYDCWRSKAVKRVIDALKIIVNPLDDLATMRLLQWCEPPFSPVEIQSFIAEAAEKGQSLLRVIDKQFFKTIGVLGEEPHETKDIIREIMTAIKGDGADDDHRHLNEWLAQLPDGFTDIQRFLSYIATRRIEDDIKEKENSVKLMTMHSAKGMEFSTVFIIGCGEGSIPQTKQDSDPEEERRVFYVGMTRAKDALCLLRPNTRQRYGKVVEVEASRFLKEMGDADSN